MLVGIRHAPFLPLALFAALTGGLLFATTNTAHAQNRLCGSYEALTERLTGQFGERMVASGVSTNGRAYVEFWASEKSGTWSVVMVLPNGVSCLTSAGRDFEMQPASLTQDEPPVI